MSDSAQSDRQHGALPAETAAVDPTAEVDLVDSASANLLLQSLDITTSEEDGDKDHEPAVIEPQMMEADAARDMSPLKEEQEVKDRVSTDDKSSQEEYLQSDKERHEDVVREEMLTTVASCDEDQLFDRTAEYTTQLQSASEQEASGSGDTESDKVIEVSPERLSEERSVGIAERQSDSELQDDEQQKKYTEVVPQISISVCSSVSAEDDGLTTVEETSIPEQLIDGRSEEDVTDVISDHRSEVTTESLLLEEPSEEETERDDIVTDTEMKKELEHQATEPATPEVERNLSHYQLQREKEIQEVSVTAEHEKYGLTEVQQLHDTKLLCSSTESMVSSTASDWTVIDTREEAESVDNFSAVVSAEKDVTDTQQQLVDEPVSTSSYMTQAELAVSDKSHRDAFEVKDEAFAGELDESVEDEDEEIDAVEDYLTATVTPTVDLMVMSTALESILEEEERTSSSQKTTSSSEKLEHDVSDSSKLVGSSPDVQHAADSPTSHLAGKFTSGKSSDRDDASVSSSLAEFERLERELQDKGSSDSFSGDKGSSESASAAALPESPQRKSSTSLSSSLAEFERIEHEILGQSGSLELITIDRKSHHTDSSSFSELERIEEMDKNGTSAEEQFRSSSGSLAEFEYIEQQLRLNEELESEALKVATMLEKSRTSSAKKSPETGSSQGDVRLSKEQIPESVENVSTEEIAQPAASAEAQYPHYQDIVHIIREASKGVQTFQFSEHETSETSTATETVSQVGVITTLQQEETASTLFHVETSSVKTTLSEEVSATASTDSVSRTEHMVFVGHSDDVELRSVSDTQDVTYEPEPEKSYLIITESQTEDHEVTDVRTVEETEASASGVIAKEELSETVGESAEPVIQQREDADLMMLSTDSLVGIQSDDVMQLSTDSLQPGTVMTTSTDSLENPEDADIHGSSTSTLSSATTLLAADDDGRCLMERSTDSLESDSREPSGEWVTVYEADSVQERHEKDSERDVLAESTDSLEAEFGAESDHQLIGDEGGVVSGSASYESFEADSLQDDVEEEPTLVSSQSQDSLLVAGAATTPMDISFGSSGAWSQSNVSSCTTLASSSDGEALTCSVDVSTPSGGGAADRRLSEPSSTTPPTTWSYASGAALSIDNTATVLDSEGNVVIVPVSDEPRTPRLDDLDNRQSSRPENTDKQSVSQTVDRQPLEPTGYHGYTEHETEVGEAAAAAAGDVLPGTL